jgi:hypothetical protein
MAIMLDPYDSAENYLMKVAFLVLAVIIFTGCGSPPKNFNQPIVSQTSDPKLQHCVEVIAIFLAESDIYNDNLMNATKAFNKCMPSQ